MRALALFALLLPASAAAQDWPVYAGDAGGAALLAPRPDRPRERRAPRGGLADPHRRPRRRAPPPAHMAFQATPILVDGLLVLPTPLGRVLALDPATGAERWRFDATVTNREVPEFTSRGVALLARRGRRRGRALRGAHLRRHGRVAPVRASTRRPGRPARASARDGEVSLREGVGEIRPGSYTISSPPAVAGDLVIVGSAIGDNARVTRRAASCAATTRAAARCAGPGTRSRAAARIRPTPSGRASRPRAPAPPTPGRSSRTTRSAICSSCRPAARARTTTAASGSAQPLRQLGGGAARQHGRTGLALPDRAPRPLGLRRARAAGAHDVVRDGAEVPVVVQATKMGHLFVLHRETGEPLFPVEERPVPASDVPGEEAWPTQPFPLLPPPLVPQTLRPEDAWGLTPWDRGRCRKKHRGAAQRGHLHAAEPAGDLMFPGNAGGSNWGSVAIDPAAAGAATTRRTSPSWCG
jgi:quinoprotein glucose dehydrogenase